MVVIGLGFVVADVVDDIVVVEELAISPLKFKDCYHVKEFLFDLRIRLRSNHP